MVVAKLLHRGDLIVALRFHDDGNIASVEGDDEVALEAALLGEESQLNQEMPVGAAGIQALAAKLNLERREDGWVAEVTGLEDEGGLPEGAIA